MPSARGEEEPQGRHDHPDNAAHQGTGSPGHDPGSAEDDSEKIAPGQQSGCGYVGHIQHSPGTAAADGADGAEPAGLEPAVSGKAAGEAEDEAESRRLVLERDGHRFEIRYGPGEEPQVLDGLARLAQSRDGLSWFDAAMLSHQLGQKLRRRLRRCNESA